MEEIERIIGMDFANELHDEINEALENGADYDDIESIMNCYGLEMDYFDKLIA